MTFKRRISVFILLIVTVTLILIQNKPIANRTAGGEVMEQNRVTHTENENTTEPKNLIFTAAIYCTSSPQAFFIELDTNKVFTTWRGASKTKYFTNQNDFFNQKTPIVFESTKLSEQDYEELVSALGRYEKNSSPCPEGKWPSTHHSWEAQFFYKDLHYLQPNTPSPDEEVLIKELVRLTPIPLYLGIGMAPFFHELTDPKWDWKLLDLAVLVDE